MNWTALAPHLWRFIAQILGGILAYLLLRQTGVHTFTAGEAEGLATLILLIGSIYAVMFAFVIFVIWGQFTDVENFAMRECNSLKDLLRFSHYLHADSHRAVRRAVSEYAQRVARSEWAALGERRKDLQTENTFAALMNAVIRITPGSPEESAVHHRLIGIVRDAGGHRDERLAKSSTQIPPTLLRLLNVMAGALLLLVLVFPFHHLVVGAGSFVVVATVLFTANLVMRDTDNPFKGVCNVSPQPFLDLTL
jgi:hypothetical protein